MCCSTRCHTDYNRTTSFSYTLKLARTRTRPIARNRTGTTTLLTHPLFWDRTTTRSTILLKRSRAPVVTVLPAMADITAALSSVSWRAL